jgi:hypothetical protein
MKGLKLKEYEETTIIEMRKYHPIAIVRERALTLELLNKGEIREEVSKTLSRTKKTISNY